MTGFDDLAEFFRNPQEILRQHQEQLQKAEELQRQLGEIKGTAKSDDNRIEVSFSQANGIDELALDPRAMRMPSEDLAAEIKRLVNEALADMQRQAEALTNQAFAEGAPDPEEVTEQLPQMQQQLDEMLRDTRDTGNQLDEMVERMRAMLPDEDSLRRPQ